MFNQHLKASQTLDELDYSEFTVHTAFAYRIASERIEVELFAGPSVFTTEIELIDEISLTGVSSVTLNNTAIGFNAGAGLAYYFTETWGASFLVRFSQADIEVQREGGEPLGFKAGGLRFGGGIQDQVLKLLPGASLLYLRMGGCGENR